MAKSHTPPSIPSTLLSRLTRGLDEDLRPRRLTLLAIVAIMLHGPLDTTVSLLAWGLESNPIVVELGPLAWIAIKISMILATAWVVHDARRSTPRAYTRPAVAWCVVLCLLGLVLIVPNYLVAAGVWL